jgi:Dyp-type peroxidase family
MNDVRIDPAAAIKKFGDSQGNIIKAHGRTHSTFLFLEFGDLALARQFIQQLLDGLSTGPDADRDTVRITSTKEQLEYRAARKQLEEQLGRKLAPHAKEGDAGLFTSLLFTAVGLAHLQVPTMPAEATTQAPAPAGAPAPQGRSDAFAQGMRAISTQKLLTDPASATWDEDWRLDQPEGPHAIHAMLLLADSSERPVRLQPAVNFIKERARSLGITICVKQDGNRLLDAETSTHDIEHFKYADGVSQPLYLSNDLGATPHEHHQRDVALTAEELVFVEDKLAGPDTSAKKAAEKSWGSFMVFRKLKQDVAAFKQQEKKIGGPTGLDLDDTERAGAMLVGRFENGTPVTLSPTDINGAGKPIFTNNFDYTDDTAGMRCPFHAHIRKVNPRGDTKDDAVEMKRRITRRGVPYGDIPDDELVADGQERGLLFVCYQRNIGQQFEFMQAGWANDPNFIQSATDLDPVIGQGPRGQMTFPKEWRAAPDDSAPTGKAGFDQHVTLRGGEYFYAPSMSGLRALAGVMDNAVAAIG